MSATQLEKKYLESIQSRHIADAEYRRAVGTSAESAARAAWDRAEESCRQAHDAWLRST